MSQNNHLDDDHVEQLRHALVDDLGIIVEAALAPVSTRLDGVSKRLDGLTVKVTPLIERHEKEELDRMLNAQVEERLQARLKALGISDAALSQTNPPSLGAPTTLPPSSFPSAPPTDPLAPIPTQSTAVPRAHTTGESQPPEPKPTAAEVMAKSASGLVDAFAGVIQWATKQHVVWWVVLAGLTVSSHSAAGLRAIELGFEYLAKLSQVELDQLDQPPKKSTPPKGPESEDDTESKLDTGIPANAEEEMNDIRIPAPTLDTPSAPYPSL